MKQVQDLVRSKLEAHAGQVEAAALWAKLWTAYEKGGADEAAGLLADLLESRTGEDAVEMEGGKS